MRISLSPVVLTFVTFANHLLVPICILLAFPLSLTYASYLVLRDFLLQLCFFDCPTLVSQFHILHMTVSTACNYIESPLSSQDSDAITAKCTRSLFRSHVVLGNEMSNIDHDQLIWHGLQMGLCCFDYVLAPPMIS